MESRIKKLSESLNQNEAVLIFSECNRFYFTGFNSSAGVLVITPQKSVLFIDFRYIEKAKQTVKGADVILVTDTYRQI